MKRSFVLAHPQARANARLAVQNAPEGYVVTISEPTRGLQANAAMWSILTDISEQVIWHGRKLTPENWKHIFSSTLHKQDVVPNLDGTGFVVMGISTSSMSKREMSDLIELIAAFGAQHGVQFSAQDRARAA